MISAQRCGQQCRAVRQVVPPRYQRVQNVRTRAAESAVETHLVREINPDVFYELTQNSEVPVLVDFFTQWCGPCKMIAPQIEAMAAEYEGRMIMTKIDCGAYEKSFAQRNGIKALPTFQVWQKGRMLGETTGANVQKLRAFINTHAL